FLTYNLKNLNTNVWIGLNDKNEEHRFLWTDGKGVYYTNWAKGHPTGSYLYSHNDEEDCASIKSGVYLNAGKWIDEDCSLNRGYICQTNKNPALPSAPTQASTDNTFKFGGETFKIVTTKMKWDEARRKCRSDDSQLVSIVDEYTQSFLRIHTSKYREPFWIGLNSNMTGKQYSWTDKWKLRYTKWAAGEPTSKNACVYMDIDGEWKTSSCNANYFSVCKQSDVIPPTDPPQKPGKCPPEWSWIPFRSHCYYIQTLNTKTWSQASLECLRLASVCRPAELQTSHPANVTSGQGGEKGVAGQCDVKIYIEGVGQRWS
ncbi:hypothetical protein GDO86_011873, partial [Hymenochirus boettgeri]